MIKVYIPNNNIAERRYILDTLLADFLGLEYQLKIKSKESRVDDWIIELESGNRLIIQDHFFNKFPKDLEYLQKDNIPKDVKFVYNKYAPLGNIPVIYGASTISTINYQPSTLTCTIDIFASSFFMLTRWEEYVNKTRDSHNRFPATASLAYRFNFLQRPVVNEYLEMLKNMLLELGFSGEFKKREYKLILTHDVDHIYAWDSFWKWTYNILRDLVKRTSLKNFLWTLNDYIKIKRGLAKDPYDTFDYIMDFSDKLGVKSHFFFMGRGETKYDNDYFSGSKEVKAIAKKIKDRGHLIGMHPTYNTYNSYEQFKKEKEELEHNLETKIVFGREHYLRFEVPTTWQVWEDNNMEWDSTLSYADEDGFRCGVCYSYRVFNFLTREHLKLKERPLIFMDVVDIDKFPPKKMQEVVFKLISKVEKYKGEAVILWHNSNFNTIKWKNYKKIYEAIIDYHLDRGLGCRV